MKTFTFCALPRTPIRADEAWITGNGCVHVYRPRDQLVPDKIPTPRWWILDGDRVTMFIPTPEGMAEVKY